MSARDKTADGKVCGNALVSRASACLFLSAFSSCRLDMVAPYNGGQGATGPENLCHQVSTAHDLWWGSAHQIEVIKSTPTCSAMLAGTSWPMRPSQPVPTLEGQTEFACVAYCPWNE